ncbi:primosomal protein N' [bacterium]|nr:MAG: primosomal protein N' [bacterium]
MLYAKIVVGLAVSGPFDYIVPDELAQKISAGCRVKVNFSNRIIVGYVVGLTRRSKISNLKNLLTLIDATPLLDKKMLELTQELSDYYVCSWGEAIETALPEGIRKGKPVCIKDTVKKTGAVIGTKAMLLHDLGGLARWKIYLNQIKATLENGQTAVIILPDIEAVFRTKKIIEEQLGCSYVLLYRKQPKEIEEWEKIKQGRIELVIGTRSAVFAPLPNLGLIIIDDEHSQVYKQDQVPHYHARKVAMMRSKIEGARVILGSVSPALESILSARKKQIDYRLLSRSKKLPEIKILNMKNLPALDKKNKLILSRYLSDNILATITGKGKVLVFINRRGFATFTYCHSCGKALACPRCNVNLVFHFAGRLLVCHRCNFTMPLPDICPSCNAGYIKYTGLGTEKAESELARIFPQARIKIIDSACQLDLKEADIFISTESIIGKVDCSFELIAVLSIDSSLNRIDFRAPEKAFFLLSGVSGLTENKIIIQTNLPHHYLFKAIENNQPEVFFDQELKQRKQLSLPPFTHTCLVKLRGKVEAKIKEASTALFSKLTVANKDKSIKIVANTAGQPLKLRGNFYWQILLKSNSVSKLSKFLKIHLKDFRHSGIIVTVDMDP